MFYIKLSSLDDAFKLARIFTECDVDADVGKSRYAVDVKDVEGLTLLGIPSIQPLYIRGKITLELMDKLDEFIVNKRF